MINKRPPLFQPWTKEEIEEYQAIANWELEPSHIYTIKNIFSRDYASQFQKYSREDIQEYQKIEKELEPFYDTKEILRDNPEARMEYITSVLEIIGYNFKTDGSNALAEREGKAKALVLLEGTFLIEKRNYSRIAVKEATIKALTLVEKIFLMEKQI